MRARSAARSKASPVSGVWTSSGRWLTAARASARFIGYRKYTVGSLTPARAATAATVIRAKPRLASTSPAASTMAASTLGSRGLRHPAHSRDNSKEGVIADRVLLGVVASADI